MYEVKVTGGIVSGALSGDGKIVSYKGIPFAAPPVGQLRFKRPQPPIPWQGVRECTSFSKSAQQEHQSPFMCWSKEFIIDTSLGYSEDRLYLNVWTSTDVGETNKPVIVYIHGGGNNAGGASCDVYDGEKIARKGCVYVSINYRVSALGFMAHPALSAENDEHSSGNYALMDQIAALKWVKDNIASFGGNPDNVTVAGQSAGAMDIHMLLHSPLSRGLFKRAMPMSFNPLGYKCPTLREQEQKAVAAYGDISADELRAMPCEELISRWSGLGPCSDGYVLPQSDDEGKERRFDLISGMVDGDISLFALLRTSGHGMADVKITKDWYIDTINKEFGDLAQECLNLYPATDDQNVEDAVAQLNVDSMIFNQFRLAQAYPNANIWLYQFKHVMPGPEAEKWGAFHTADVPYWLGKLSTEREEWWTDYDRLLAEQMSDLLCAFALSGVPAVSGLSKWDKFDSTAPACYEIGEDMHMYHMDASKLNFWQKFFASKDIGLLA